VSLHAQPVMTSLCPWAFTMTVTGPQVLEPPAFATVMVYEVSVVGDGAYDPLAVVETEGVRGRSDMKVLMHYGKIYGGYAHFDVYA